jgi:hypothetical protein
MKALTQAIKRIVRWLVLVVACFLTASTLTKMLELYKPTMARRMPRKSTLAWLLGYEPSESSPTSY